MDNLKRLYDANKAAMRFFMSKLSGEPMNYLLNVRNMTMKTIKDFGIGFAPDDWNYTVNYLKKYGLTEEELIEAKLAIRSENGKVFSFFRNRIMYPIIDINGNVIGFGGRKWQELNKGPKYLNTGETPVFHKGKNLYGLNFIPNKPPYIIICEGYMDAIALHSHGINLAAAGLGTALTIDQVKLVKSLTNRVILLYDNDDAGFNAAKSAVELCKTVGLSAEIAIMSEYKDADEYLKSNSAELFSYEILNRTLNASEFQLHYNNRIFGKHPKELFQKNLNVLVDEFLKI